MVSSRAEGFCLSCRSGDEGMGALGEAGQALRTLDTSEAV